MKKLPQKNNKAFEQWAMKILKKLQTILLLSDYEPLEIEVMPDGRSLAECQFYYPYKTITIRYTSELVKDWQNGKKQKVISVLAHEMSHVVTDPFYAKTTTLWTSKSEIEDERERLTDHIANIVLKNNLM